MNIEFLGAAYIVGKSVDYILQSQSHAELKSKNLKILIQHSLIYSIWTASIVFFIVPHNVITIFLVTFTLFISHSLIDQRDPVKFIMFLKGIKYEEMNTKYAWLQIAIDQRLHELVILMLSLVI